MAKRISIGTWAYTIGPYQNDPVPFEEVCSKLKELKFDGLELGAFNFHAKAHPNYYNCPTKESRLAVLETMKKHGLEFSGIAADLWNYPGHEIHLADATDGGAGYLAEFRKLLEFTVDLGIKVFRVDTVQDPNILSGKTPAAVDVARNNVIKVWKEAAKIAQGVGVDLSWEFEPGFVFNRPSDILRIIHEINEPNFGAMFDTCHAYTVGVVGAKQTGGPQETVDGGVLGFARKLRGKINHIQLIDSDGSLHDDHTSTHNPFFTGKVDFGPVLQELNAHSGVKHDWWTIDLCFWPDAWPGTAEAKKACDLLNKKYGSPPAAAPAPVKPVAKPAAKPSKKAAAKPKPAAKKAIAKAKPKPKAKAKSRPKPKAKAAPAKKPAKKTKTKARR
jgi:sugar phosphate isomerase/epimerase